MLEQLTHDWQKLENKVRFVIEIIEGTLVVSNRKKVDLFADLKKRGYTPFYKGKAQDTVEEDDDDSGGPDSGFDYLFSMSIWYLYAFMAGT